MYRVGYNLSFKHPNLGEFMRKFWGMHQDAVPKWQKALLSLVLPGLVFFIKTVQSTEDDQAVSTSKRVINQTIKEVTKTDSTSFCHLLYRRSVS